MNGGRSRAIVHFRAVEMSSPTCDDTRRKTAQRHWRMQNRTTMSTGAMTALLAPSANQEMAFAVASSQPCDWPSCQNHVFAPRSRALAAVRSEATTAANARPTAIRQTPSTAIRGADDRGGRRWVDSSMPQASPGLECP